MTSATINVYADINNDEGWDLTLTSYIIKEYGDISIQRGINENREYESSELSFSLDNRSGDFSIDDTTGTYVGKWGIGVPIKLTTTKDAVETTQWYGFITDLSYEYDYRLKARVCTVRANDISFLFEQINASVIYAKNITTSQALRSVATSVPSIYSFGKDYASKIANPGTAVAGTGNGIAFHPSGKFVAIAHATSPYVSVYQWTGAALGSKLTNPSSLPAGTCNGVAWSPNGTVLGVAHSTSPYFSLYAFDAPSETIGIRFTDPSTLPTGTGRGIDFSVDSQYVAVAHDTSPYVSVYPIIGPTTVQNSGFNLAGTAAGSGWTNPNNALADDGTNASYQTTTVPETTTVLALTNYGFSLPTDATVVGVEALAEYYADTTADWDQPQFRLYYAGIQVGDIIYGNEFTTLTEYTLGDSEELWGNALTYSIVNSSIFGISVTSRQGSNAAGQSFYVDKIKLKIYYTRPYVGAIISNPGTLPAGNGNSVAFSPGGNFIAVAHATSPYVSVYPWTGTAFGTKITDPSTTPGSEGKSVCWGQQDTYLAIASVSSPYINMYKWNNSKFGTKLTNPTSLPAGQGNGVSISLDNKQVAIAHNTTPYLTLYYFDDKSILNSITNGLTLPAGNGSGVDFDNVSGCVGASHASTPYIAIYSGNNILDFEIGSQILPYFVRKDEGTVWELLKEIAKHERGGVLYVAKNGKLTFKNRTSTLIPAIDSSNSIGPDHSPGAGQDKINPSHILYEARSEDRIEKFSLNCKSYKQGTAGTVIYSEARGSTNSPADSIAIAAYGVYEAKLTYNVDHVLKIEPLTATTDYTFNAAADGSGADKTSNVSIQFYDYGSEADIFIFNDTNATIYMTKFQIRGTPLSPPSNDAFITLLETLKVGATFNYDLLWMTGVLSEEFIYLPVSRETQDYAVSKLKTYRYTNPRIDMSFDWNSPNTSQDSINDFFVDLELFDVFRYSDSTLDTEEKAFVDSLLRVYSIDQTFSVDSLVSTRISFLPAWLLRNQDKIAWDNFQRSNGSVGTSPTGHSWTASDYTISSNTLLGPNTAVSGTYFAVLDLASASQIVEAKVAGLASSTNKHGIVFRYSDSSNYLTFYQTSSGPVVWKLDKVVAGVTTNLDTFSYSGTASTETTHAVRVICYDDYIKCYLNYQEVININDSSLNTNTKVGVMQYSSNFNSNTAYVDNFYAQGF